MELSGAHTGQVSLLKRWRANLNWGSVVLPSLPKKSHFNADVAVQHEQDFVTNTVVINSDTVQGSSATLWTVTIFVPANKLCIG